MKFPIQIHTLHALQGGGQASQIFEFTVEAVNRIDAEQWLKTEYFKAFDGVNNQIKSFCFISSARGNSVHWTPAFREQFYQAFVMDYPETERAGLLAHHLQRMSQPSRVVSLTTEPTQFAKL